MSNINNFGRYKEGLTPKELKEYLKESFNTTRLGSLFTKFLKYSKLKDRKDEMNELTVIPREDIQNSIDKMKTKGIRA